MKRIIVAALLLIPGIVALVTAERTSKAMEAIFKVSKAPAAPMDADAPARTETATFAMGWFWGPDARFGHLEGVVRTRVGYSGGSKADPTYTSLGDHSETIEIDYDPTRTSYKDLLELFWQWHDPTKKSWSRQYRSAIFYHGEEQKKLALKTRAAAEKILGKVYTAVEPASAFYLAEDYHQKYYLQQVSILKKEYRAMYPDTKSFVASTAAARVNGYVAGFGTLASLKKDMSGLGLSPLARARLLEIVSSQ
jgi:peptide-methionine (S)-S-oxide reductase